MIFVVIILYKFYYKCKVNNFHFFANLRKIKMDSIEDSHQNRIVELVHDEEKLVTSALIANDLKISLSEATTLLKQFFEDSSKLKLGELHSTYLLCGSLKDNKGSVIYLVKDEDLQEKRDLFKNISSEVIYSVQKAKQIDYNMIALTNTCNDNFAGCLVSKNCVKRNVKVKTLPPPPSTNIKEKGSFFKKVGSQPKPATEVNLKESGKEPSQSSQKQSKVSSVKPKQNGGIASFFAKAPTKSEKDIKAKSDEKKNEDETKAGAAAFIKKSSEENTESNEKMDVDIEVEKPVAQKVQNQSNKKRKKSNKNDLPSKKRKRIQEICDSDSGSDIFEDDERENIIDGSDEEPVEIPVTKATPVPKNKKRRAVDKTYVDEEVTSVEYIYESASEDEKEIPKKEFQQKPKVLSEKPELEKTTTTKGKNKKPISGKQPTLMSFFKKC
ncbi:uncharacterized protein LOC123014363 isoform X2 [Tribolium madens]|uniref:uncharacterized protein LOC123014363 isoform X2 n=1 Tax=Tribolium madens TaxID=41895 RepID=UPI001CF73622|nr:uncharacterized protein LOC123014363 isoform X2 [Tribolium madens]